MASGRSLIRAPTPAHVLVIGAVLAAAFWWLEKDLQDGTLEVTLVIIAVFTAVYWKAARDGWP